MSEGVAQDTYWCCRIRVQMRFTNVWFKLLSTLVQVASYLVITSILSYFCTAATLVVR